METIIKFLGAVLFIAAFIALVGVLWAFPTISLPPSQYYLPTSLWVESSYRIPI